MIERLRVQNFMGHQPIHLSRVAGINVLIGKNDTGKTGLLKLMYAIVKSTEVYGMRSRSESTSYRREISDKLYDTFKPRRAGLGDLVSKGSNEALECEVSMGTDGSLLQQIFFHFGDRTERNIQRCTEQVAIIDRTVQNALFIPSKEVLTIINEVQATRDQFMPGFDDTYLDLIKALRLPHVQGRVEANLATVNERLANLFSGEIRQTGDPDQPFEFRRGNQRFAMSQTSEGIKKIGILSTLIRNRQINSGTVLFMDEPETALHPKAIRDLVNMLGMMGNAGIQIFIATHSYFVLKQLALIAKRDQLPVDCWSLERSEDGIQMHIDDLRNGLPDNAITQESLAMYADDVKVDLQIS